MGAGNRPGGAELFILRIPAQTWIQTATRGQRMDVAPAQFREPKTRRQTAIGRRVPAGDRWMA